MIDIVEVPAPHEVGNVIDQGLLLPIPGAAKNTVLFEPRDGEEVRVLTAKAVTFKIGDRIALRVRKVRIDLFITDARFALACSRYDKGGGWVGGATAMVVFNTVSKARAAVRSRGKMLAGQVRYPWLRWVASAPKTGFNSEEALALQCAAEDGTTMTLNLHLPKNIEAALVAAEIAERAARYRLASEDLEDGTRAALEALLGTAERVTAGEKQSFSMPAPRPVSEESARLEPRGRSEPAADERVRPDEEPLPREEELDEVVAFCSACGEKVGVEDVFCSSCGVELAR